MEIRKFTIKQAVQWINCGWRLGKKRLMTWLSTSMLLTFAALLLGFIPVIGIVTTAFLFPIVLCSSMIVTDRFNNPDAPRPDSGSKRTRGFIASVRYTKDMLFSAFGKEHSILAMMGMAAGMMVFGIVVEIVMRAVSSGVVNNPAHFWELSGSQFVSLFAAYAVAYLLYLLLAMSFFYAIPLFILRDFELGAAVKLSLSATARNFIPFVVYAAVLASPLVLALIIASAFGLAGFGVKFIAGTAVWMLFMNSMYCSYRLTLK